MSVKLDYKDTVKKENLLLGCSRCSRKRDGKYLEKIGTYNPNTNPATIDLNLMIAQLDGCTMVLNQQILLKQFFTKEFIETSP
jgi:hypothetical protein